MGKTNIIFILLVGVWIWIFAVSVQIVNAGDGEGTAIIISPSKPIMAGSSQEIKIEFTVGENGMEVDGEIIVGPPNWNVKQCHPFIVWSIPQTDDPAQDGYITVSSTGAGEIEPYIEIIPHETNQECYTYRIHAKITVEPLIENDKITITYGDRSGGGSGTRVQDLPQNAEFAVFTDVDGDGLAHRIRRSPKVKILGDKPWAMQVVIPSIVKASEPFDLRVVIVDKGGYRATGYTGKVSFESSDFFAQLPNDYPSDHQEWTINTFGDISFSTPGIQTITVRDVATGRSWTSNPCYVLKEVDFFQNIYWGDIHWHSRLSDGVRSPDEGYLYALEDASLDFTAMVDHDVVDATINNWSIIQERAEYYNALNPGKFVTFLAYEWTSIFYGHKNVYYFPDNQPIFSCQDPRFDEPTELWAVLESRKALTIAHHPAKNMPLPTDWDYRNYELQPLVEIFSTQGNSEYEGSQPQVNDPAPGHFVQDALQAGHILGIIASSDCHLSSPGNTHRTRGNGLIAAFAPSLNRKNILRAMNRRQVYGTTGRRVILFFTINGNMMGSMITSSEAVIKVRAVGTSTIEKIEIIRGGVDDDIRVIHTEYPMGIESTFIFMDEEFMNFKNKSIHYYYVRVILTEKIKTATEDIGHMAWSSPIWVTKSDNITTP